MRILQDFKYDIYYVEENKTIYIYPPVSVYAFKEIKKELEDKIEKAIEYIKQYEEIYYPDEPLSEPIITYNLGIYEEDFDEAKLLNILRGKDE